MDWELKRETATELLGFFKEIFKDQGCAHDSSTSQCQTEEIRTSLSCKGQGLNTHMLNEIADGGAAVEEGKRKEKNLIWLSRDLGFSFLTLPSDLGETTLEACLGRTIFKSLKNINFSRFRIGFRTGPNQYGGRGSTGNKLMDERPEVQKRLC